MTREFDLNIERVLENWTVAHALREVIANALDEQALTGTREPQIFRDAQGAWHVRDWGRGLRYDHLTQNELQSLPEFAGTVLHELSHALSGAPDVSLEFEHQLTGELGGIASRSITNA